MSEEGEENDICGAELAYKDETCTNKPKYSDGLCGFHTEENTLMPRYKHGLSLDKGEYFESLPEDEKKWIDSVSYDLLEKSRYSEEDISMKEKCRQIAVDLHQKRRADGYVAKKGLTQENTVGFHEQYGEITETQENVLMITKDRLSRESRLSMKDLGILDEDSDGDSGDAESLIEKFSQA